MAVARRNTWPSGFACSVAALALGALFASETFAASPGWSLVWSDEFDSFDSSKWTAVQSFEPTNNSLHAYLPSQIEVQEGNLVITSENTPAGGLKYRSGQVVSKPSWKHGRWEVRAKLPSTTGMWPAIWLLPDVHQYPWPSGGEIDIMENRGNQPSLTSSAFHWGGRNPYWHRFLFGEQQTSRQGVLDSYHTEFHTYAVDWLEDSLRFYVDDVHHFTVYDQDVGNLLSTDVAPMQLVINTAVGGDFLPNPDGSTVWPQRLEVDYVRVYELDETPPPAVLRNSGFEDDDGSLAGWSTFGNRVVDNPNVSIQEEIVRSGEASLKLFGQFVEGENYSGASQGITVAAGDRVEAAVQCYIRSEDSIAGTDNSTLMKVEFYRAFGGKYGSPDMISEVVELIADGESANDQWASHELSAIAPDGAVEARLSLVFRQVQQAPGAIHIDAVRFENVDLPTPADANSDGRVDGTDLLNWQRGFGGVDGAELQDGDFNSDGVVDSLDLQVWASQYGECAPCVQSTKGAVPHAVVEPSTTALALLAAIGFLESTSMRKPLEIL